MNEGDGEQQFTYTPTVAPAPQLQPQSAPQPQASKPSASTVQWEASEFVDHEKNNNWFVLLGVATVAACGVIYLLSGSIFSVVVIIFAAAAFGVTANQKPRTMQYALLPAELKIGERRYKYDDFRSFSLMREGALWSVVLQPTKRFMPLITIYFDPNDGEKIFDILASQMPHEERKLDAVDQLMRRIRF